MFGVDFLIYAVIAGLVISLAAAGASAYMQYQSGQAQKKASKFNAEVQANQAEQQKQIAAGRAEDIRKRNRIMLAQGEANAAAGGLALEPGTSPLLVLANNAKEGELDALRATWYGDVNAEALTANARMSRFQGANAAYASNWGAGTTLLSGLSNTGQQATRYYASQYTGA